MIDKRRKEIKELLARELESHPSLAGFEGELREIMLDYYFTNRRFTQMRLPRSRDLTDKEDFECLRESISEVMGRRRGKILLIGPKKFTRKAYDSLYRIGFDISTAGDIKEGVGMVLSGDPVVAIVYEKYMPNREFSKQMRISNIDLPPAIVPALERDFEGRDLLEMTKTLDQLIEGTGRVPRIASIALIEPDPIGISIADALDEKGIEAKVFGNADEAKFHEPTMTQISIEGLTGEQKIFMIEAARDPDYTPRDMLLVLKHLDSGRPIDFRTVLKYASALREFGIEQYAMRQFCRHSGNMARVRATTDRMVTERFGDTEEIQNDEIQRVARRNALQYFLNEGSGEDLHNRFMSKAFGAGYREFLLGAGQREYLTDEAFLNYVIRSVIRYSESPEEELAHGVMSEHELEAATSSIQKQLKIPAEEKSDKFRQLAAAFAERGIESRRLYRSVSLDSIVRDLGGKKRAGGLKKRVGERFKELTASYISDEIYGPKDLSSIIREEKRIEIPSKNNVFRISAKMMGLGSVDAVVKVFDFRRDRQGNPLNEAARKRKTHEFEKEVRAADYYSRWGINKGVHFFFEEYDEFGAVMMRYWGEHDLYDTIAELDRLIAHEAHKREGYNASLIDRWSARKDVIWANLLKRIAEVHAFSPDVGSRAKDKICDPTEDFEERIKRMFRRRKKGETHLLQPFEQLGSRQLCNRFRRVLGNIRKSCAAFAEYLEKSPALQTRVASKDLSLKNWFESGSRLEEAVRAEDIKPIDYGSIRALPAQMDVGNAFMTSHIIGDPDALRHYSKHYTYAYESAVKRYNKRLRTMAGSIVEAAKTQFRKEELCRKSARKYLPGLAEAVAGKLEDAVSSDAECRALKDGKIHLDVIKAMKGASSGYISSLQKRKGKDAVDPVDIGYLRMFAGNAARFFRSAKIKKGFLSGCRSKKEKEGMIDRFWEGMLASMAYTTFRNLGVYVDRLSASIFGWLQEDPIELAGEIGSMLDEGAVSSLDSFLKIYKGKIGQKEGSYTYTQESYREIARLNSELKKASELYISLKKLNMMIGAQQKLPGFKGE